MRRERGRPRGDDRRRLRAEHVAWGCHGSRHIVKIRNEHALFADPKLRSLRGALTAGFFFVAAEHQHVLDGFYFAEPEMSERRQLLLFPTECASGVRLLLRKLAFRLGDIAIHLNLFCR